MLSTRNSHYTSTLILTLINGLDSKDFQDEVEDLAASEEIIMLEEEEKVKATESPFWKVHTFNHKSSYFWLNHAHISYAT